MLECGSVEKSVSRVWWTCDIAVKCVLFSIFIWDFCIASTSQHTTYVRNLSVCARRLGDIHSYSNFHSRSKCK